MADKIRQLANAAIAAATSTKNKYFTNSRKGENFELKAELNSDRRDVRKEAVKKVIANMTVGKDVSPLFADVLKCMQTEDLELKKLVYLYLMNYAKSHPELVILAVNTFCKDTEDPNPLLRALAIRTMGCIRVDKMMDYLCEPLNKTLNDENPYVRKTAALCVAKVYDLSPELAEENGFLTALQGMLSDNNPMVVSNAVAALCEIQESYPNSHALKIDSFVLTKLLAALNECTEWGQTFILDALAEYKPVNMEESVSIVERVMPRLQHANGAVTLTAVKVLMIHLEKLNPNSELAKSVFKKMASSLVTLLAFIPEVQYVALRNIKIVLEKYPELLANDIRMFFCKYNDPLYVKLEKLDVMVKLASDSNLDQVLSELKEYAAEVDVEFVKKAIQCIGKCAINVMNASDRCIAVLVELLKTKVNYVVQESIVVITDIFRKFPNRYEGIIGVLCESLESLDEPESRAAMIWIVGEYAEKIENSQDLLAHFMENFESENVTVQLQLLTAAIKIFLKKPNSSPEYVEKTIQNIIGGSDNADIRDRAYFYSRLMAMDKQTAASVVLAPKPIIIDNSSDINSALLNELIHNISSLSSVFHQPATAFVSTARIAPITELSQSQIDLVVRSENNIEEVINATAAMGGVADLLDLDMTGTASPPPATINSAGSVNNNSRLVDLLTEELGVSDISPSTVAPSKVSPTTQFAVPMFGGITSPSSTGSSAFPLSSSLPAPKIQYSTFLHENQGKGMSIEGAFTSAGGQVGMDMIFKNSSPKPISDIAIQFNKNSFGMVPMSNISMSSPLLPGQTFQCAVPLAFGGPVLKMTPINVLQVAVKNNVDVYYFQVDVPFHVFFNKTVSMNMDTFSGLWNSAQEQLSQTFTCRCPISDIESMMKSLGFTTFHNNTSSNKIDSVVCFVNNLGLAVSVELDGQACQAEIKTTVADLLQPFMKYFENSVLLPLNQ